MFVAKTIEVGDTPVDLTAGLDLDQPTRIRLRAGFSSSGAVAIGSSDAVTYTTGYPLVYGEPVDFSVDGDAVWAVTSSLTVPVALLAWTE